MARTFRRSGSGSIAVSPLDIASGVRDARGRRRLRASRWRSGGSSSPMARTTPRRAGACRRRKRAISEGTAAIVTRILEQNVQSGTGTRAAFGRPAAGKTGTNEEHADAWFAGLHAGSRDDGLARLHEGRDPDGERPRDRREPAAASRPRSGGSSWSRRSRRSSRRLSRAGRMAAVEAVHPRSIRVGVRPERHAVGEHGDRDHREGQTREASAATLRSGSPVAGPAPCRSC